MPTASIFEAHPPFPADVPILELPRISFQKLLSGDSAESEELFKTAKETGFFLLDLRGTAEGDGLLENAEGVLELDKRFGDLDVEAKEGFKANPPKQLFG